jgi:hypothetical protein
MSPVVIRYWGVLPLRKRTYLILQGIVFVVLAAALVYVLTLPPQPRFGLVDAHLPFLVRWIFDHLLLIVLVTAGLEILDTIFTLIAYARKEKAQAGTP